MLNQEMYFEAVQQLCSKLDDPKLKGSTKAKLQQELKELDPTGVIEKYIRGGSVGERPDIKGIIARNKQSASKGGGAESKKQQKKSSNKSSDKSIAEKSSSKSSGSNDKSKSSSSYNNDYEEVNIRTKAYIDFTVIGIARVIRLVGRSR